MKRSLGKCDFAVEDAWKNALGKKELLKEVEEAASSKIPDPETMPPSEKKRKKDPETASKEDVNIQFAAMSEEEQLASLAAALDSDSGDKKGPGTASASAEVGAGDTPITKRKKKEKEPKEEAPEKDTKKSKKAEKSEKGETAAKKAESKQKSAKAAPKSAVGLAASFAKGKSSK